MDLTDFGQVEPTCDSPHKDGCTRCSLTLRERVKAGCIFVMEVGE